MGKKHYYFLLFLMLFIACFHVNAQYSFDFSAVNNDGDTLYYNIISNDPPEVAVANCMSKDSAYMRDIIGFYTEHQYFEGGKNIFREDFDSFIVIPSNVEYKNKLYTVTEIGDMAFMCQSKIHTIILPETINKISTRAFGNSYLTNITIPNSVRSIDDAAFEYSNIDSIVLPKDISYIGIGAFQGTKIRCIEIPGSVKILKELTFAFCSSLKHLVLNEGLQEIESNSLLDCKNLDTLYIPASVKKVARLSSGVHEIYGFKCYLKHIEFAPGSNPYLAGYAFANCLNLQSIVLREKMTLSKGCFKDCKQLKSITISNRNTEIPEYCFYGCESLEEVTLPESIVTIRNFAFYSCTNLKKVDLPKSLESIGWNAFEQCTSLRSIIIPKKVKLIDDMAFWSGEDTTLTEIWMLGSPPPQLGSYYVFPSHYNILIHIPCNSTPLYENADPWMYYPALIYYEECASVDEYSTDETISVFPNPTVGTLNIVSNDQTISKVELYNNIGKLIGSKEEFGNSSTIFIDQPAGIYFLSISLSDGSRTIKKIIKK